MTREFDFWALVVFGRRYVIFEARRVKKKPNAKLSTNKSIAVFALISLVFLFLHAQFRPFYSSPMNPIIFAQEYALLRSENDVA